MDLVGEDFSRSWVLFLRGSMFRFIFVRYREVRVLGSVFV